MSKTQAELDTLMSDLLCSAFEGGSNYWYLIERYEYPLGKTRKDFRYPHVEVPFQEGGAIIIRDTEGDQGTGENAKGNVYRLDRAALAKGWALMRDEYARHYADAMGEDSDAVTGDVFLQCCLFGEVVYG